MKYLRNIFGAYTICQMQFIHILNVLYKIVLCYYSILSNRKAQRKSSIKTKTKQSKKQANKKNKNKKTNTNKNQKQKNQQKNKNKG